MRLIIVTGKGGVGKTSTSAATARRAASLGYKTMIMSTDSAHSLSDSMEVHLGPTIANIGPNLDALEIDIIYEMKTRWSAIKDYISSFMVSQGFEDLTAEEMAIFPGMEMVAALMYVLDFDENNKYDVVVMDTAPTAETIRLLSFPDVSQWYAGRLLRIIKKLLGLARFTVGRFIDMPLPSKEVIASVSELKNRMNEVGKILEDPTKTTLRLVVNPERMVINETKRAYSYFCLYNKTVECLVVNRIYPKNAGDEYFTEKIAEQEKYLEMIHQSFDPMKMLFAYQMPTEMLGDDKLDKLADMIYGDSDPTKIYATESPMSFKSDSECHMIILKAPFVEKGDIELYKLGSDSLVVRIGSQKRNINLPLSLANAEMMGAELKDEKLIIKFKRDTNEG